MVVIDKSAINNWIHNRPLGQMDPAFQEHVCSSIWIQYRCHQNAAERATDPKWQAHHAGLAASYWSALSNLLGLRSDP